MKVNINSRESGSFSGTSEQAISFAFAVGIALGTIEMFKSIAVKVKDPQLVREINLIDGHVRSPEFREKVIEADRKSYSVR